MIDELTLITGNDIYFSNPPIAVHQPTLKEIGLLGQGNFYLATSILTKPKKVIKLDNPEYAEFADEFDVLMAGLRDNSPYSNCAKILLQLMFINYQIQLVGNQIILIDKNNEQRVINFENFDDFKGVLIEIFKLKDMTGSELEVKENDGPMVRRLKEQFRKRHETLARVKGISNEQIDVLSRYMSIVSIGLNLSIIELNNYTVYQLFDEYTRFQLRDNFNLYIKRACSFGGVKKEEKIENWMKNLNDNSESDN